MTQPSWIGQKLSDRYEIEALLGEGGMSAVYKANDPNLRRVVAIKLIHSHLTNKPEFVRRFEEEAAAVAQLRHPNIMQVYDFARDSSGVFYIVFEFLAGETLQGQLSRLNSSGRNMPYSTVVKVGTDIVGALEYAHGRDLVHRDVKPANIMLNFEGDAILMDFGIVKIAGGTQHTATGAVLGTARYMSPEQIRGESIDHRSDIYAMGVMLFEMVSGRAPFVADSVMTLMMQQVNDPVPDLQSIRPGVPGDLVHIIERAMAKDRNHRYQSASEMLRDLQAANLTSTNTSATMLEGAAGLAGATRLEQPPAATSMPQTGVAQPAGNATIIERQPTPSQTAAGQTGAATAPPATAPPVKAADGGSSNRRTPLLIGCVAMIVIALCAGGLYAIFGTSFGDSLLGREEATAIAEEPTEEATEIVEEATEVVDAEATEPSEEEVVDEPTEVVEEATATEPPTPTEPPATSTETVVATEAPTEVPTAVPTDTPIPPTNTVPPPPTNTAAPAAPSVSITNISLSGSTYIVDYTTSGYTEALPGMHIHFFFNTITPENAGVGGSGPWVVWGGPRPFNGYSTGDRGGATQMCALVANENHTINLGSGNCFPLPDG